ncbi:MAG: hypothetical protein NUW01_19240 [Gemmatimonadaceae bacterium]|nr:hypothetical protein [Gemmatimonadaceae bacterium]
MLLAKLLRSSLLLEGEPDGGGTASPPSESPIDPQADPTPADVPAEGAPSQEAAPDEETPPGEGEGAPADDVWGSDETWEALREQYPDRFPKPEAKPEPVPTVLQPRSNPVREYAAENGRQAWDRVAEATKAVQAGEELPATFLADVELVGSWTNAEAEGRQLDLAERLLERALGIDPAKINLDDPIQARYHDALTAREKAHVNAGREFNRVYREPDPAKRAEILARAERQQATATAAFLLERDAIHAAFFERKGELKAEQAAGKRITKAVETTAKNGRTEALAKAAANLRAGAATATAGINGKDAHHYTWAEIQKMDQKQLDALPEGEFDRAMNEG